MFSYGISFPQKTPGKSSWSNFSPLSESPPRFLHCHQDGRSDAGRRTQWQHENQKLVMQDGDYGSLWWYFHHRNQPNHHIATKMGLVLDDHCILGHSSLLWHAQDETSRPSRGVRRQQCRVQVRVKAHRDSQNNLCREGAPDAQFTLCSWVCLRIGSLWLVNFPRFPWPWNENGGIPNFHSQSAQVVDRSWFLGPNMSSAGWLGDPLKFSAQGGDHRGCHDPVYEGGGSSPHVWLVEHWWTVQWLALLALPQDGIQAPNQVSGGPTICEIL